MSGTSSPTTMLDCLSPGRDVQRPIPLGYQQGKEFFQALQGQIGGGPFGIGGRPKEEVVDLVTSHAAELTHDLDRYLDHGRADWRREFTTRLRAHIDTTFNDPDGPRAVGSDPQLLVRLVTTLEHLNSILAEAQRGLQGTIKAIEDQNPNPINDARSRKAQREQELPEKVNKSEAEAYLEASEELAFCERWRATMSTASQLLADLAVLTNEMLLPFGDLLGDVNGFISTTRKAADVALNEIVQYDIPRPSLMFVPTPQTPAFDALAQDIRFRLRKERGDKPADLVALKRVTWQAMLPEGDPKNWGVMIWTPKVSDNNPEQDGWHFHPDGPRKTKIISSPFLAEMLTHGLDREPGTLTLVERLSLYDVLATEYRSNVAPAHDGVASDDLLRQFVEDTLTPILDAAGVLGPYTATRLSGGQTVAPAEHLYCFQDPGTPGPDRDRGCNRAQLGPAHQGCTRPAAGGRYERPAWQPASADRAQRVERHPH
jgi:hypothetical protein